MQNSLEQRVENLEKKFAELEKPLKIPANFREIIKKKY